MTLKITHSLSAGRSKRQQRILSTYVVKVCLLLSVALALALLFRGQTMESTMTVYTGLLFVANRNEIDSTDSAASDHHNPVDVGPAHALPTTDTSLSDHNHTPIHQTACSSDQLRIIKQQLRPEKCEQSRNKPWLQRCSFTQATKCPDPVWLHEFHSKATEPSSSSSFLSYFIGCNKAIDAVNALRLGSNNPTIDVLKWQEQLRRGGSKFDGSSCAQFEKGQVDISPSKGVVNDAQVHCFEPITNAFAELDRTKRELGWGDELVLIHGAFSSTSGNLSVPSFESSNMVGTENVDINQLTKQCLSDTQQQQEQQEQQQTAPTGKGKCIHVPIMTLDDYYHQHGHGKVHYISIDVEGYDALVLQGGVKTLRDHVMYVEFENNWKGPWSTISLSSVLSNLEDIGFTCYWPGMNGEIWRITGCWLDHYDIGHWSNVACVNQNDKEATSLSARMEELFLETLQKTDVVYE